MSELIITNSRGKITEVKAYGGNQYNTRFFEGIRLSLNDSDIKDPYSQHVWTFACINAISTAIKRPEFMIVKDTEESNSRMKQIGKIREFANEMRKAAKKGRVKNYKTEMKTRGIEPVYSGEVYDLFQTVNPLMVQKQLFEATATNMLLTGECFWLLQGRNGPVEPNETPKEIWVFSGKEFQMIVGDDGMFKGWKPTNSKRFKVKKFEKHQLVRFYKYNPSDEKKGFAVADVIKKAASQDYKSQLFNEAFFVNGGEPGGILRVKEFITDKQYNQLMNKWEDRHKGPGKHNKTALLQGGAEYDRTPVSHSDMQFLEGRKWNRDETLAGYGVPKMKVQLYEDINLATAKIIDRAFWTDRIIPELLYYEDIINNKIISTMKGSENLYCIFDLSNIESLREDMDMLSKVSKVYNEIGFPAADINERLNLGFETKEYQKKWWKPFNLEPVSDDEEYNNEPPDDGEDKQPSTSIKKDIARLDSVIENYGIKKKKIELWEMWIARVFDPIEKKYRNRIRNYFFQLRKHQLEKWKNATKEKTAEQITRVIMSDNEIASALFSLPEWQDKLVGIATPFIEQAAGETLAQTAEELNTSVISIDDPRIAEVLKTKKNKIKGITTRFWEDLRKSLVDGVSGDESLLQLTDRIKEKFNIVGSPSRALTIARTETAQVASTVRYKNFKIEGVKKQEWVTAGDENVRDDHVSFMAAGPQKVGDNFMQIVGKSGTLLHPSDIGGPADQVINCRCLAVPIIKK